MPSIVYGDLLLRAYEYNFWLYQYIARKYKIECEYGYDFSRQGELVQTKKPIEPMNSSKVLIKILNQIAGHDGIFPFGLAGQEKIQLFIK